MIEKFENIWDSDVDVVCITTNGNVYLDANGNYYNPMAGGIAREACFQWDVFSHEKSYKTLQVIYGESINKYGHTVRYLGTIRKAHKKSKILLAFPTMYRIGEQASLGLIATSMLQLNNYSLIHPELKIGLPRPGCNIGGLDWDTQVKRVVDKLLQGVEDRIIIYNYA